MNNRTEPTSLQTSQRQGLGVRGRPRARRAYVLLGLIFLVLFAAEGWREWTSRQTQLQEVQTASANLAHSLLQEAEGAVAAADAALVAIVGFLELEGTEPAALTRLSSLLVAASANQPQLRGFSVDGRNGMRLISSVPNQTLGVSNASRDYFRHHREDPDRGPLIGPPTQSRRQGYWVITISRRFQDRDGRFAGTVVTSITSATIAGTYAAFDMGREGSIALLHTNGMIMSRYPFDEAVISRILPAVPALLELAASEPAGHYNSVSAIDGVARLGSYQRSERFPLLVIVSSGTSEALAAWVHGAWFRVAAVLAVSCVIVLLGVRLIAQIQRRRQAELVLAESEAEFRMLAEHASDMVSRVGTDGVWRYASPAATRLLGVDPAELVGRRPEDHIHPEDRPEFEALVACLSFGQEQGGLIYRANRTDRSEIWVESTLRLVRDPQTGAPNGYVGISRDVTVSKELETKLAALATTDGLTGIANRRRFDDDLLTEWRRAARDGTSIALLLLDVDHFKAFNDRYGHPAGDECLRSVASSIAATIRRPGDKAARYGGEEFAVILPATDLVGALDVAERVRGAIEALSLRHEGNGTGVVTVSIGVAGTVPSPLVPIETSALIKASDEALYQAKHTGRNRVVVAPFVQAGPLIIDRLVP
ncbi:MAG: diguanylate cyclase [Rubritepida sp.]|nr:diguanylate cyclase [Rubritepida sp.]